MNNDIRLINETQAARLLGFHQSYLNRWRRGQSGPAQFPFTTYRINGHIRYNHYQITNWIQQQGENQ